MPWGLDGMGIDSFYAYCNSYRLLSKQLKSARSIIKSRYLLIRNPLYAILLSPSESSVLNRNQVSGNSHIHLGLWAINLAIS